MARTHGIKGQLVVNPETDFMEDRFKAGRTVLVGPADRVREFQIREVRFHQGRPIVGLTGIETMDDAETLAGSDVWVLESEIAPLPEGTYYRHDLVGCDAFDTKGTRLGRVTGVEGSIDRSYLVIDERMMVPLVAGIVVSVDIAGKRVTVDPPEGLFDL